MENYAMNIALVQSYVELSKSISKQIQAHLDKTDINKTYFLNSLKMQRLTFIRRLSGKIKWEPNEVLALVKALEKLEQTTFPEKLSLVHSYINLSNEIPKKIEENIKSSRVKKSYFYEQLGILRLSFYRRMTGKIGWQPDELIQLLKALAKADKINK